MSVPLRFRDYEAASAASGYRERYSLTYDPHTRLWYAFFGRRAIGREGYPSRKAAEAACCRYEARLRALKERA